MAIFAFFDESGEYSYSPQSGKYLVFTGLITATPTLFSHEFAALRYRLLEGGKCLECFHACEDTQAVRNEVFGIINSSLDFTIHSIIVRKNRVNPSLHKFGVYSIAYKTMLKYLVGRGQIDRIHIIVDTPPDKSQQRNLKIALKARADEILTAKNIIFTIDHHKSSSHALLQASDYCAWAIQKKWRTGDRRSYDLISNRIRNEFDIYASGDRDYY